MNSFIQADVFFFITTIAVVLLVVLFAVLLVYLIKIMKDAREVTKKLSEETSAILDDIHRLREFLRSEGDKIKKFTEFLGTVALARFVARKAGSKKRSKRK